MALLCQPISARKDRGVSYSNFSNFFIVFCCLRPFLLPSCCEATQLSSFRALMEVNTHEYTDHVMQTRPRPWYSAFVWLHVSDCYPGPVRAWELPWKWNNALGGTCVFSSQSAWSSVIRNGSKASIKCHLVHSVWQGDFYARLCYIKPILELLSPFPVFTPQEIRTGCPKAGLFCFDHHSFEQPEKLVSEKFW